MGMKVLVVGGGGREHALVWKIAQSPLVSTITCAPGNPGCAQYANCVAVAAEDIPGQLELAQALQPDLVVIGPELPLVLGLSDRLRELGMVVCGPSQAAAALEGSKSFMKSLLARHNIPSAAYRRFANPTEALAYVREYPPPLVIKASGVAAGKGVIICHAAEEAEAAIRRIMIAREFGEAGDEVVIEEFLTGEEASFLALVDGEEVLPLASAQDHKAVGDGDTGPNTGGMGAYSPAPVLTPERHRQVMERIMRPTVQAMAAAGRPYRGILYAGLMIDGSSIKVLEFNARFGDPETQPLLLRMKSDLVPLLMAAAHGSLRGVEIAWDERAAVCVVMAAGGYPGAYRKGDPITGLEAAACVPGVQVFHAGTRAAGEAILTAGGRVLGVTALGADVAEAQCQAYAAVELISWEGAYWRRDIGYRAVTIHHPPS